MVNYRTPRTWNLVQVEAHHKLIASVWLQIWNHDPWCGPVETKFLHYSHFQDSFSSFVCMGTELRDSVSFGFQLTLGGGGQQRRCGCPLVYTGLCSEQTFWMTKRGGSSAESLQRNCWPRRSHDLGVAGMLPVGLWPLEEQTQCVKEILFSFTFQIKSR